MRILFADDDRELCRAVRALLEHEGFTVKTVHNGLDALDAAEHEAFDCAIVDWMMPEADGITVLRTLREEGIGLPCLMLTARAEVEDRVAGLDAGADDYLPKPFSTSELLARIRALTRRHGREAAEILRFGDLTLDKGSMEVSCRDVPFRLGNKAFHLLEMLMEEPHRVFTVQQIMDRVWGWDRQPDQGVLWVTISGLRKKLAEIGSRETIQAIRGVGYSLEGQND